MLVFQRKKEEGIAINDVRVIVMEILKNKVRLGVAAPADVVVSKLEALETPPGPAKAADDGIALPPARLEFLRRLAAGTQMTSSLVVGAILEALEETAVDFSGCTTPEQVKERLSQALAPKHS